MATFLERVQDLLENGMGSRERKAAAWAAAKELDTVAGNFGGIKAAFLSWVHECGYLRDSPPPTDGLPWSVLHQEDEVEMLIRDRHRFTRGANIRELVAAEMKDQTARWEARVNRCKVALIDGWSDGEALCFICALDEWETAQKRAGRRAA